MRTYAAALHLLLTLVWVVPAVAQQSEPRVPLAMTAPESVGMSAEKLAAAEELFAGAVTEGKVLGYQVLVARRGGVVLHSAGGLRDVENNLPMTTESLLNLASMTKSIAAVGLLKLVDEGRVSLDDHVSRYLPGFEKPPASGITLRQLLLHQG